MKVVVSINEPMLADKIESYIQQSGHRFAGHVAFDESIADTLDQYYPDVLIITLDDQGVFEYLDNFKERFLPIIFIDKEENPDHYRSSREFNISRYLVYPFPMLSLKSILDDIEEGVHHLYSTNYIRGKYIFVRHQNVFEKINIADIDYLYSEGNYTNIFIGEEKYTIKYSLSRLLDLPNFDIMIRIHRNHAVQRVEIEKVDFASRTLISRGKTFPFGRTYTKQIRQVMKLPKV